MKRDVYSPGLQHFSGAIANLRDAFLFGAVGATVDGTVFFHSVTDHMRAAMGASRSERLDCTFKAVKDVTLAVQCHLERLVVVIATSFAYRHGRLASQNLSQGATRNGVGQFQKAHTRQCPARTGSLLRK